MRVPNSGDRKLIELDFIEGILFQPEPTGDYVT
jgi:hypothetical protein